MKDTSPNKLSELTKVALRDFVKAYNSEDYSIHLDHWHNTDIRDTCRVCFAGAVIAGTLKFPKHKSWTSSPLDADDSPLSYKLSALNNVRSLAITRALRLMDQYVPTSLEQDLIKAGLKELPDELYGRVTIDDDKTFNAFVKLMARVIDFLRERGL